MLNDEALDCAPAGVVFKRVTKALVMSSTFACRRAGSTAQT